MSDDSLREENEVIHGRGAEPLPDTISDEAKRAVVFIHTKTDVKENRGTGFIATVDGDRVVLVTCNHVLPDKQIAKSEKCTVSFDRLDDKTPGTLISGKELFDLSIFKTDETKVEKWKRLLDYTIIGVNMDVLRAKLPKPPTPLPLDGFQKVTEKLQENDTVAVVHYPKPTFERCTNYQHILKMEDPIFGHSATTQGGSSGCPVFRVFQKRWVVVGLHRGELPLDAKTALTNVATRLSVIYDAYMDQLDKDLALPDVKKFAKGANAMLPESDANGADNPILLKRVDEYKDLHYLRLFRRYVSNQAAGKGRTLLKALGLSAANIAEVYGHNEESEVDAVLRGMEKWREGRASDRTWVVLLKAMDNAGFAGTDCRELREKLTDATGSAESRDDHPVLSAKVDESKDLNYQMLFRTYVGEKAAGKGTALLEELELDQAEIADVYGPINRSEPEAVQKGLEKWREGRANPPTWAVLLNAMDKAKFPQNDIKVLKGELIKYAAGKQR